MQEIRPSDNKETVGLDILLPAFGYKVKTTAISGDNSTSTFFYLPINFMLTTQQNYFSIEISFIVGIRIFINLRSNQDEQKT